MTNDQHAAEAARRLLQSRWDPEKGARLKAGAIRRHERNVLVRRSTAGAAAMVLVVAAVVGVRSSASTGSAIDAPNAAVPVRHEAPASQAHLRRLDDGSVVEALSPETNLIMASESRQVELTAGSALFRVARAAKTFEVQAGPVHVQVLGTVFVVTRAGPKTRVQVESGRVRVRWASGSAELSAGQQGTYPPEATGQGGAAPLGSAPAASAPTPTASVTPDWRRLARKGDMVAARRELVTTPNAVSSSPEELMLAADVHRLSGHPEDAVPLLRQVYTRFPGDARAPVAAFSAGRILADQLGRLEEAAAAFSTVRRLAKTGPLSEDALAREIEIRARAGQAARARSLAADYRRLYPRGRYRSRLDPLLGPERR